MRVSNLTVVATAALCLALSAAQAQDDDELAVQSAQARGVPKPWKSVRGVGRVLDLTKLPLVIDEPGLYAIDRNWQIPSVVANVNRELIHITANGVTLDLHGFEISADVGPGLSTLLVITGRGAEIRNGGLVACCDGGIAVHSTSNPFLHHVSMLSDQSTTFEGDGTRISDSRISRESIRLAGSSTLERNTIGCDVACVVLGGDGNVVMNNRISPFDFGGISILGNENVVADNVMDATNVADLVVGFDVRGDHNVVRNNTVLIGQNVRQLWRISGTANTLDGNIGAPGMPVPGVPRMQARVGMEFTADGNFYGDNRMAAEVPFALGGTVQTDWGGNVEY